MKNEINFGIGFITGRENSCKIINSYYEYIINQVKVLPNKVNFTFFILYDTNFINTKEEDFYKINPEVKKCMKIKHLSPDYLIELKSKIAKKYELTSEEVDLIIGNGYAKARNSILCEAIEEKIDYLLFWDDDEYPLAAIEDGKNIIWQKQDNILQHIKNIENADITYGYRCGIINPLPTIEYTETITEDIYHKFIDALENEVVSWEKVQNMQKEDLGIGFANKEIAEHTAHNIELKGIGQTDFVLGSGICLNLTHLDKIPAFYTPPEARGEDTFFSCALKDCGARVIRIPVYHFHDAFLKFKFLMEEKFPKRLKKITNEDDGVALRFKRTTIGWTKYKPLFYYIIQKESYKDIMNKTRANLEQSVNQMSTAFPNSDLTVLLNVLDDYDKNVEKHYNEYIKTIEVWNKLKKRIIK